MLLLFEKVRKMTEVVFFVVSLPPLRRGDNARYEVTDSSVSLPRGARVIGDSSTLHFSRAVEFRKQCEEGSFWKRRKARANRRFREDKAHRERVRKAYAEGKYPPKKFDWSKYELMCA